MLKLTFQFWKFQMTTFNSGSQKINSKSCICLNFFTNKNAIYNCIESKKMSDHVITLNAHLIDGRATNLMWRKIETTIRGLCNFWDVRNVFRQNVLFIHCRFGRVLKPWFVDHERYYFINPWLSHSSNVDEGCWRKIYVGERPVRWWKLKIVQEPSFHQHTSPTYI